MTEQPAWGPRDALYDENTRLREQLRQAEADLAKQQQRATAFERDLAEAKAALAKGGDLAAKAEALSAELGGARAAQTELQQARAQVARFETELKAARDQFAALRAAHGSTLVSARDKLFMFLCGWLGGPDYYVQKHGHPMLRARHLPFAIGIQERNQWVQCMDQAMGEVGVDPQLRARLHDSFMNTADWMRNKHV